MLTYFIFILKVLKIEYFITIRMIARKKEKWRWKKEKEKKFLEWVIRNLDR